MIEDKEIAIISAASKALELMEKNPHVEVEEIIKIVMGNLDAKSEEKIPAIAAIDAVVKLKRENLNMGNKQIIQKLLDNYRARNNPQ